MADAGAGTHYLDIARDGAAFVAKTVLVGDSAFTHIGDDFHVGMRVRGKAGVGRDGIVIPHADATPAHARLIVIIGEREVMFGIEPAVVGAA